MLDYPEVEKDIEAVSSIKALIEPIHIWIVSWDRASGMLHC